MIKNKVYKHQTVHHSAREYVKEKAHTDVIKSFLVFLIGFPLFIIMVVVPWVLSLLFAFLLGGIIFVMTTDSVWLDTLITPYNSLSS